MNWMEEVKDNVNVQGSAAWKKWRGKGVGSSDAAVLLGLSPWKDIVQLWEEKLGLSTPEFSEFQLSAMDRGKRLEPEIRRWYENHVGAEFPDGIAEHPEYKFIRASFDGINNTLKKVLEIKAPNMKDHSLALQGIVPEKYYPQCQWLMMVAGYKVCDYVSYGSNNTNAIIEIAKDENMQSELLKRAVKFWECVETKTEPNLLDFPKYEHTQNTPEQIDLLAPSELDTIVNEALSLTANIQALEGRLTFLKDKLKAHLGTKDSMESGIAVFGWQTRKGTVDYGSIPELKEVNLDAYRKPDTKAFYFKRIQK